MALLRTERFKKDFKALPADLQERVGVMLERFVVNPRHPSLRVKKMEGGSDVWELRVSDHYRITFQFAREGVLLRRVGTHDVLRQP
jgi:mRNA-degrading endonuclease RelE of RelBE toxin-antitoxin system